MAPECSKCGRKLETTNAVCRCTCPPNALDPASAEIKVTGYPPGIAIEGPLDSVHGRRVDSRPASGGHANSSTNHTGAFTAELSDPLDRGEANQEHAVSVLAQALRDTGTKVERLGGARNDYGEDALLSIDGRRTVVQVVTLPVDQALWEKLSTDGMAARTGTIGDAIGLVRHGLLHKKGRAGGTLLLLDAAHVGAIISQSLVEAYRAAYGDPEKEFSLIQAWIVGPTARSAIRLGGPPATRG